MPAATLYCYAVKVGARCVSIWATGAAAAIGEAIDRFGTMAASAKRVA